MAKTPASDHEALELEPAATRELVELAPVGIFVSDSTGRCTYVNRALCQLLGYSRNELLGLTLGDLLPECERRQLAEVNAALLQGRMDTREWNLRRADRTYVAVEVSANMLPHGQWHAYVRDVTASRAAEAQRMALAARGHLQALVGTLPLAAFAFDAAGTMTANRHAQELFRIEFAPELGAQQYAGRLFLPDGNPLPQDKLPSARALNGESVIGEELLLRRADGTDIPVLVTAAPILEEQGQCVGAVALFQDASERMQLQRARENERLLKAVFELLPVGVWIADRAGRIVSTNPAGERIWGGARFVPIEQFDQYEGWRVSDGRRIGAQEWALARAIRDAETCTGEVVRIRGFDGSTKTIINSAAPLIDETGNIEGAIGLNEDISALHGAQEKQATSEQLFRTVFDLLPVGVWISDREGKIVSGNPAGQQIWQGARYVDPDESSTYKGWWIETGAPVGPDEWGLTRAVRQGEISRRELIRIRCFDGSFKTVINWAAPIRSDSGEITGAVLVNEDVSPLQQTQEQLRAAVRDREQLLAVVTHDLRNPLNAILATTMLIDSKAAALADGEGVRSLATTVADVARQMSGLVNDLLTVAVASDARSVLKTKPIRSTALVEKAARAARPIFALEGVGLELEVDSDLPILHVDADRLLRVFANLLDNARKFTQSAGRVTLSARASSAGVRFCISNSGPSLSTAEIDSMFQPFWQAARGDNRGKGLGLAICRAMIEAHGGTIWAEPAQGQRVRVCFLVPSARPIAFSHTRP